MYNCFYEIDPSMIFSSDRSKKKKLKIMMLVMKNIALTLLKRKSVRLTFIDLDSEIASRCQQVKSVFVLLTRRKPSMFCAKR